MELNLGMSSIITLLILALVIIAVFLGVKIVSQSQVYVVERFGKYTKTLSAGLNFIVPFLDRIAHKIDILERQLPEKENSVITKDNVEILLKTAVFYRVVDASRAVYRISNIDQAIETAVIGVIRAVCGAMEFDDVQAKRDAINAKIRIRSEEGSYIFDNDPITLKDETLFSTKVSLPSNLIEGDYKIKIYLVQDKKLINLSTDIIEVRKVGLERWLHKIAHEQSLFYGMFSIFLALFFGWGASTLFRRFQK